MGYRNYNTANGFLVDKLGNGDFTTIAAALAASSSGKTIFLRPGTYTENPTLIAGIDIVAYVTDADNPNVIINGTITASYTGSASMSGICLQTNSGLFLTTTGTNTGTLRLNDCLLNITNNDGMTFANANFTVFFINSIGIQQAGFKTFTLTAANGIEFDNCRLGAFDGTASTIASSQVSFYNSTVGIPISTSSTGSAFYRNSLLQPFTNSTALSTAGTGTTTISNCNLDSGSSSCISVGAGTTVVLTTSSVKSSNTNAITGAGTLQYGGVTFTGSSSTINTTTQVPIPFSVPQGGTGGSTFTAYSLIAAGTTATGNFQNVSGVGTSGQVLTSNGASALPSWQNNIGAVWSDNSGTFNAVANNGYFITAASTPTLPASPSEGDRVQFIVDTASACTITGNTGQKIRIGSAISASAGTAASTAQGDSISLVYRATGTTWFSDGSPEGIWTVT